MQQAPHLFHIPVMGTGFTVDSPIRLAHLGINSVISLVDDHLLEKVRKHYAKKYDLSYESIPLRIKDARAKRIKAYLDLVADIVKINFDHLKNLSIFRDEAKRKYFEMLPFNHPLKKQFLTLLKIEPSEERLLMEKRLTDQMVPGSIDVNIMVKIDRKHLDKKGQSLGFEYTDAKAAIRGFVGSKVNAAVVLSAGINPSLFKYISSFPEFYFNRETKEIKKRIILKVSDFRSAYIQGKTLAKKGLSVYEYRIESGLNCGGHAFPSNGKLLPVILKEFKEKRNALMQDFQAPILDYYQAKGWSAPGSFHLYSAVSVQGGVGTHGEMMRLIKYFNIDYVGWASAFLLVPEATCVDKKTRHQLAMAQTKDLYLSGASPLGVPFNNMYKTGSENHTKKLAQQGKPGSKCPKRFLVSNTEFSETPICTASAQYQESKLQQIRSKSISESARLKMEAEVLEKVCLCDHLANGALIELGLIDEKLAPPCVCPGPNTAWYNRFYTLAEMVNHIYGIGQPLTSPIRPHMFAAEIVMYVDFFENLLKDWSQGKTIHYDLDEFKYNLTEGMKYVLQLAEQPPIADENLNSIHLIIQKQIQRLELMDSKRLQARMLGATPQELKQACAD